eukprot:symbB.v1.2.026532.t1/scaffold2659.1/size73661/2
MACFQWLLGRSPTSTEIIKPSKSCDSTEIVVPKGEQMFGLMPLCFATYPAIALRLPHFDEKRLKQSLSKALELVPCAAGRFKGDAEIIEINGQGVPFTVVESSEASAPQRIEEIKLLSFATLYRPWGVRQGYSPPVAIKLTTYKDGSGVLAFSRSHMLFDGGSAWTFLGIWASLAKGDSVPKVVWQKEQMMKQVPGESEFRELAMKIFGVNPKPSMLTGLLKRIVIPLVGAIMDTFFLHVGWSLTRHHLFFSDDDLALLKEEATPKQVSADMDNWVTTQEALCAHMLLALVRHTVPKSCSGNVQIVFLLDARKALGLPSDQIMGNGLTFCRILIPTQKVFGMDLPGLASYLHEALARNEGSLESQRELWKTVSGACELGLSNEIMQAVHRGKNMDLRFAVNNSSKRPLPDFGSGRCESTITNAGPTIFLPAKGGIDVHFDPSVFSSTGCSKAQRLEALQAFKALPKKFK